MMGLSFWQPWGTLVVIAAKLYETRSWSTRWRGRLLIHAARSKESLPVCNQEPYASVLRDAGYSLGTLPLGAALGVADLVEVVRTEEIRDVLSDQERAFGDYRDRRFAWKLANVRTFPEPISMPGQQGLFDVEAQYLPLIRAQMIAYHRLHGGLAQCPSCGRMAARGAEIRHEATCAAPGAEEVE